MKAPTGDRPPRLDIQTHSVTHVSEAFQNNNTLPSNEVRKNVILGKSGFANVTLTVEQIGVVLRELNLDLSLTPIRKRIVLLFYSFHPFCVVIEMLTQSQYPFSCFPSSFSYIFQLLRYLNNNQIRAGNHYLISFIVLIFFLHASVIKKKKTKQLRCEQYFFLILCFLENQSIKSNKRMYFLFPLPFLFFIKQGVLPLSCIYVC